MNNRGQKDVLVHPVCPKGEPLRIFFRLKNQPRQRECALIKSRKYPNLPLTFISGNSGVIHMCCCPANVPLISPFLLNHDGKLEDLTILEYVLNLLYVHECLCQMLLVILSLYSQKLNLLFENSTILLTAFIISVKNFS